MGENNFMERIPQAHPAEIYVPTATAQHSNLLDLIKGLSPTTTWANTPSSIRQLPHATPTATYQLPHTDNYDKQISETARRAPPNLPPPGDSKTKTIHNNALTTLNIS